MLENLRKWFVIHFVVDIFVAVPLLLVPEQALNFLGWEIVDPIASRMVAAAFFAIGLESYLGRNAGFEAYSNMLDLKIIWSTLVIVGLVLSIIQGSVSNPLVLWMIVFVFLIFDFVWIYWRIRLAKRT